MNKDEKEIQLKCLVVSDIHHKTEFLTEITLGSNQKYDYCFALGDYLSLGPDEIDKEDIIQKGEKEIKEMIEILEQLCHQVIYISGNHDPFSFFKKPYPKLTDKSIYLHKDIIKLYDDLYIVGIGGSVAATEASSNFKSLIWEGYPHNQLTYKESDQSFSKELIETFCLIQENSEAQQAKLILLSHNGPINDDTTFVNTKDEKVQSGSICLRKIIETHPNIIINLHGHTHLGKNETIINSTIISNPGSIKGRKYSEVFFNKTPQSAWTIKTNYYEIK